MSKKPVEIRVDAESNAAYVRYTDAEYHESIDVHPTGAVAADVDAAGAIIGIEILGITNADHLILAAKYANDHGLAFPRDLAGALAA